jgi:hypothetical protein
MAILDFLKKLKFPKFEDDFIQDDFEKELEGAPGFYGGKVVKDPHLTSETQISRENFRKWMDDEWERHSDPSDGASMSPVDAWDE